MLTRELVTSGVNCIERNYLEPPRLLFELFVARKFRVACNAHEERLHLLTEAHVQAWQISEACYPQVKVKDMIL